MSRSEQIEDRAARWLIRREDEKWSAEDEQALNAWLDEAEIHKIAYWRLKHCWREADRVGALGTAAAPHEDWASGPRHWAGWRPLAAAASILLALGVGWTYLDKPVPQPAAPPATFEAALGGRKIVSLNEGSRIEINTASRVRALLSSARREVWLDKGEAYFEVAHLADRPFIVHAGSRDITVLGTKFSVRRDGGKVTVSVVEGRVRVDGPDQKGHAAAAIITSGDIAVANGASTLLAEKSGQRVDNALSWRTGMLRFNQTPLGEAAQEFNRYNGDHIVVADPALADLRIGGAFPASTPRAFARLMRDFYGLKLVEEEGEIRLSQ